MLPARAKLLAPIVAAALAASLLAGCSSSTPASGTSATDGAAIVQATCGRCHPLQRVQTAQHDRAGWTTTVARMRAHGAQLTDQQAQAVVDYLVKQSGGS